MRVPQGALAGVFGGQTSVVSDARVAHQVSSIPRLNVALARPEPEITEYLLDKGAVATGHAFSKHATFQQLHAGGSLTVPLVSHDQMEVIAGDRVVEDTQPVAPARFIEPAKPQAPVASEAQEELAPMTSVGQVPHVPSEPITTCARHGRATF